jgi:hypothetical protein
LPAAREPGKMMSPTFYETDNSKSVGNISGFIHNPIIPTFCMTLSKTKSSDPKLILTDQLPTLQNLFNKIMS